MSIVAARLSQALAERGIDQSMLARRVGATQGTISKIIQGTTRNSRYLPRIAHELGVSLPWLMGAEDRAGEGPAISAEDREWVDLLRQVPAPDRAALLQLGRTAWTSNASARWAIAVISTQRWWRASGQWSIPMIWP